MSTNNPHPMDATKAAPQIFDPRDRIVIGMPCYGGIMQAEVAIALNKAQSKLTARFKADNEQGFELLPVIAEMLILKNESHVDRARNNVVNKFMRMPFNMLMFWDADVEPMNPTIEIARLWMHCMKGKHVVGGTYALKSVVPSFCINGINGATVDEDGAIEVHNCGTGWKLHHRSAFEALEREGKAEEFELGANHPDCATMKTHRCYFKSGVRKMPDGRKLWLSEDYMFDYEWRKIGGKIHIDTKILLKHHGAQAFPITPDEAFAAAGFFQAQAKAAESVAEQAVD